MRHRNIAPVGNSSRESLERRGEEENEIYYCVAVNVFENNHDTITLSHMFELEMNNYSNELL